MVSLVVITLDHIFNEALVKTEQVLNKMHNTLANLYTTIQKQRENVGFFSLTDLPYLMHLIPVV